MGLQPAGESIGMGEVAAWRRTGAGDPPRAGEVTGEARGNGTGVREEGGKLNAEVDKGDKETEAADRAMDNAEAALANIMGSGGREDPVTNSGRGERV